MSLFKRELHPHKPMNPNVLHELELMAASFSQRVAIGLTKAVGTMACAYLFALLAIAGFPGLLGPFASQMVQWISQTFIQLVMLSVIMVGQSVLGRKQEIQSDEQFNTTVKTYHDIEQVLKHLEAQDQELIKQTQLLLELLQGRERHE